MFDQSVNLNEVNLDNMWLLGWLLSCVDVEHSHSTPIPIHRKYK